MENLFIGLSTLTLCIISFVSGIWFTLSTLLFYNHYEYEDFEFIKAILALANDNNITIFTRILVLVLLLPGIVINFIVYCIITTLIKN